MTTTTLSTVLSELAGSFERRIRSDSKAFYTIINNAPDWVARKAEDHSTLMHRVHEAIDDRLPDDWVYEKAARIAQALTERDIKSLDTFRREDVLHEIVGGMVDVYNADLTRWLASHLGNIALCDEAVEEMGVGSADGIVGAIQAGQYRALEAIAYALLSEVEAEMERRGGEE